MMSPAACFHADQAWRQVGEEHCDLVSSQLLAQHGLAVLVHAVDLEHVLGQIDTNCRNLHGGRPFRFEWSITLPLWHIDAVIGSGRPSHWVRTPSFTAQPPHLRRLAFGHKSFAVIRLLALTGAASDAVRVPRLTLYDPRFLPTLGHPHAVALHLTRCGQLGRGPGLAPRRSRPCWAHETRKRPSGRLLFQGRQERAASTRETFG